MISCNRLLNNYNFHIFQDDSFFKFSLDSVLLADFIDGISSNDFCIDLCTGNSAVILLLLQKFNAKFIGIEIQKDIFDLALMSVLVNRVENKVKIFNSDAKNVSSLFKSGVFDVVTCNPPYFEYCSSSIVSSNYIKSCARHEILIDISDIISSASYLLKDYGVLYLVYRPDRLSFVFECLRKFCFEPKVIRFVYSYENSESNMILIKCVKRAKVGLKILSPLILYNADGSYSDSYRSIIDKF